MDFRTVVHIVILLCCMVGVTTAGQCGVNAPRISLSELHAGCNSDARSRHPVCVAAMHRFCGRTTFPRNITTLGVSREHTNGVIGMSCIHSRWSGNVPISTLQQYHGGCTVAKSQHRDCLSAIHRHCMATLGQQFAGTSQEVPRAGYLYVKCFESTQKEHVRHDVLRARHGGCTFPNSYSNSCYAAASRWCVSLGYSGGITQEVNDVGITVACYNAEFSNDEFVARTTGFYQAERRVSVVCDPLNFDMNNGNIVSQIPRLFKMETYDNRASSVALHSTFSVSVEITETHSFTRHSTFSIGTDISVTARLPFFHEGTIAVSTSFTTGVSLSRENTKTFSYSVTSPVNVPPGHAITKEAGMHKATLDVPWSVRVVNGLGQEKMMYGQWRGVSTYNYYVRQTDDSDDCNCVCSTEK